MQKLEVTAHSYPSECVFSSLTDIENKKVTIMGLGLNGGGEASVRFFLSHGANVTVTDMKTAEQLAKTITALAPETKQFGDKLKFVLGKHEITDFEDCDVVIKNPGVKYEGNKFLAAAKAIETDLSIFLRFTKAPIIAVTGSKGKSSTASAIYFGLKQAGFNAFLGGNITVSPLTFLEQTESTTPVVLELSSWQLADLRGRKVLKPKIALITPIVPDHQNWYGNMESYVEDKKIIYSEQDENDWTICQAKDKWADIFAYETKGKVLRYGEEPTQNFVGAWLDKKNRGLIQLPHQNREFVLDNLSVPGKHMRANALNAALVMSLIGIPAKATKEILSTWHGIPHRLEYFHSWTYKGNTVPFYNDSAATVPEATAAAMVSFVQEKKSLYLICGGTDKELDFSILSQKLEQTPPCSLYLLSGTGTDKLVALLNQNNVKYNGPYANLLDLLKALKTHLEIQCKDDCVVVFSPGATSFGMFKNEFDRGDTYKSLVKELF